MGSSEIRRNSAERQFWAPSGRSEWKALAGNGLAGLGE
jgi:hypothetical protein